MKTTKLKPRAARSAEAVLAAVKQAGPRQPPAAVQVVDKPTTLNLRLRTASFLALQAHANAQGQTLKQVVCTALRAAGVEVSEADLEDRTPRRKL